jgi:hypothetical protein|tara:strand:- start:16 stop:297 length:282 start_codon:yes stop_codon:yes gene_type:complete
MARSHKKVAADGTITEVLFTTQEETDRDAEEVAVTASAPLRLWKGQIAATDIQMPRISEDIIDSMDATQKAALPLLVRDNHAAKKTLRGQRPA